MLLFWCRGVDPVALASNLFMLKIGGGDKTRFRSGSLCSTQAQALALFSRFGLFPEALFLFFCILHSLQLLSCLGPFVATERVSSLL